jgi:hypothetical protein
MYKNINIYDTKLISLDRYLNLVLTKLFRNKNVDSFSINLVKLVAQTQMTTIILGRRE